ncbi:MAG: acyltransferase [Ruminococcaceae bacterium]|nr:acyltransferase [Oscillospiraceae bacterium]
MLRKIGLFVNLKFLRIMHKLNYRYYLKHFPLYLKKIGVRFSGDISNTGFIASSAKFDSLAYSHLIELGENTIISAKVLFLVHDYSIGTAIRSVRPVTKGKMPHFLKEIKIGNNCFIGIRSIILPGTTIGDNCIIGAGSVVKGNIPAGSIVAGNPAKIIKTTEEYALYHLEKGDFIGELPEI